MKKPKGKYAWTVTVGEKGQIVIPKQARDVFGINPGDTLVILGAVSYTHLDVYKRQASYSLSINLLSIAVSLYPDG